MELPSFFDAGCCDLHTMHGAFQIGAVATNWLLDKYLYGMWKHLLTSLSPALRIFPSVFVKPAGLKMKMWMQKLLKFGLILYK